MTDKELTLIVYPAHGRWVAESQTFKYLHPLDGKEESHQFYQTSDTEEAARSRAQAQLDWFMADRGNCVFEIADWTPEQLANQPIEIDPAVMAEAHGIAASICNEMTARGAAVSLETDAKGLPVISCCLTPAVQTITFTCIVSR